MEEQVKIVPVVLTEKIGELVDKAVRVGDVVDTMGVTIVDGIYADNLSVAVEDFGKVDFGGLKVEVQLATEYPEEYVGVCKGAGVSRVFGQIERMGSVADFLNIARDTEIEVGLGLDVYTPISEIKPEFYLKMDAVLLNGTRAGMVGGSSHQKLAQLGGKAIMDHGSLIEKVEKLRNGGFAGEVYVAGGVTPEVVESVVGAGADVVWDDSFVWQGEVGEQIKKLGGKNG